MTSQPPVPVKPRGTRRVIVLSVVVGSILLVGLLGGGAYLWLSAHNAEGLEGTWRDSNDKRDCYQFRRTGEVAAYFGSPSWWNKIGWNATWRRSGQKITVHTDRHWDFVGQLDGDVIRGKMIMRNPETGAAEQEIDMTWQRE